MYSTNVITDDTDRSNITCNWVSENNYKRVRNNNNNQNVYSTIILFYT